MVYAQPWIGSASMPHSSTAMPRFCATSTMWVRLAVSCGDRDSAQAVVRAERDHEHPDVALERAIEACARVRRRLSRDARVNDLIWKPGAAHSLMQDRGISGGGSDPMT